MAKKQFKKVLSMGLSLVMCASLTVPAFAASFADLNNAIEGAGGVDLEDGWSGYGVNTDGGYDIWAKGDNDKREVVLKGNVTHEDNESSITIGGGKNVTLDLNGNTISNEGENYDQRSTIWVDNGELTLKDSTGNGKITGGQGSGIWVDSGSTLNMEGGTISGNYSKSNGTGGGVHVEGTFNMNGGTISGNHSANEGGGVYVANGAEFNMTNGTISSNESGAGGGGVYVANGAEFNMTNGTISNNKIVGNGDLHGGGVHVNGKNASFTMSGGTITGNAANAQGGGVHVHEGTFNMNGGTISDNTAKYGGGLNTWNGTVNMSSGTIGGNHAIVDGSDVWVKADGSDRSASFTMSGNSKIIGSAASENQHVVAVEGINNGQSTFTMSDSASLSSDTAKSHILAKNGSTVNYNCDDDKGLDNINTEEKELEKQVESTTDTELNIETPDSTPTPTPVVPGDGTVIEDPAVPLDDEPEVEIEDPAVPLASGPITRAEFIDYLWRHEGEPASAGVCTFTDVEDTHQFFEALCWADENGVAEAYFNAPGHEDGTFEPDELVTVGAAREFLTNFENVFGRQAVAAASLKSLTGADDEAVLNCDEVLAEFFGEAYVPAKEDDVEIAA